jgi:hypothetical protein
VIVPTAGLNDHVTPVFVVPVTAAVNCCVWEAVREAVVGVIETLIGGVMAKLALADFVGSAALVAVTAIVWVLETEAGAV